MGYKNSLKLKLAINMLLHLSGFYDHGTFLTCLFNEKVFKNLGYVLCTFILLG